VHLGCEIEGEEGTPQKEREAWPEGKERKPSWERGKRKEGRKVSLTKDDATTHEETRNWAYIEKICSSTDTGVREGIRCGVGESGRRLAAILERERNMSAEFVNRRKEEHGRERLCPQTIRSGLGLPTVILMIFVAVIVTERLRALCQKNASIERKGSWDQANLLLARKRKICSQAKPSGDPRSFG